MFYIFLSLIVLDFGYGIFLAITYPLAGFVLMLNCAFWIIILIRCRQTRNNVIQINRLNCALIGLNSRIESLEEIIAGKEDRHEVCENFSKFKKARLTYTKKMKDVTLEKGCLVEVISKCDIYYYVAWHIDSNSGLAKCFEDEFEYID